jgi:peptidoglycan/xylan/chitin deacetylase (PgdA/CDA1 family)
MSARRTVARLFRGAPARASLQLLEGLARARRGSFAVLTYHRVDERTARPWLYPPLLSATPGDLEEQMATLRTRYRPIALGDLLAALHGIRPLPPRALLVTFDDAYRDFRENAWPILKRLGIPVTLFVPTAYPDALDGAFWWDRLWQALMDSRDHGKVETPIGTLPLGEDSQRRTAGRLLVEYHKTLPHDDAMRSVEALCTRLGASPARSEVLGWDDLRELSAEGVDMATHSRTHPLMTRIRSAELVSEVRGSRDDLATHLGRGAYSAVFAYPGGQHDERTTGALSELGVELAFTTQRGVNRLGQTDPLRLRRINVGPRSHSELIRAQLTFFTLRSWIAGR